MIFTTKAEYGVRLLVELGPPVARAADHPEGDRRRRGPAARLPRADRRAAAQGRPRRATRGAHGGYRLARPAEEITMDEVVLALEGAVAPMECFVDDTTTGRVLCSHGADAGAAARPSCCGRASRAASSGARCRPRSPSSSRSRSAARPAITRPSAQVTCPSRTTAYARPRHMADLEIRQPPRPRRGQGDPQGPRPAPSHTGEIHALMGPNGSGKSTLANAIMGHPNLEVTEGQILFDGEDITEADPDERARAGPVHGLPVPGLDPGRDGHQVPAHGDERPPRGARRGGDLAEGVPPDRRGGDGADQRAAGVLERATSTTASPAARRSAWRSSSSRSSSRSSAILDETDSGLDIDALNVVAHGVNTVAAGQRHGRADHHPLPADPAHRAARAACSIMFDGRIVKEGGPELVDAARGARATAGSATRSAAAA